MGGLLAYASSTCRLWRRAGRITLDQHGNFRRICVENIVAAAGNRVDGDRLRSSVFKSLHHRGQERAKAVPSCDKRKWDIEPAAPLLAEFLVLLDCAIHAHCRSHPARARIGAGIALDILVADRLRVGGRTSQKVSEIDRLASGDQLLGQARHAMKPEMPQPWIDFDFFPWIDAG